MGRHPWGALPAIREFYQIKKEFVIERHEREVIVAKLMKESFDEGSIDL